MIYRLRDMIYGCCRMIYLLRKHDIISVPSYAKGIYHPPKAVITSKIYHPFREERISLKTPSLYHNEGVFMAERGGFEPPNGYQPLHDFQSCALDQLSHLSTMSLHDTCILQSHFLEMSTLFKKLIHKNLQAKRLVNLCCNIII